MRCIAYDLYLVDQACVVSLLAHYDGDLHGIGRVAQKLDGT